VEENEYRSVYNERTTIRCVFEKALTNHKAKCSLSDHFCLADREGYACKDTASSSNCREILDKLRDNSRFVLKLREIEGPLPHNMEIRVQAGGLMGVARLVDQLPAEGRLAASDIKTVVQAVIALYGSLDALPYDEIVQSIVKYQGRKRRQR
jgi:hypothetical protein